MKKERTKERDWSVTKKDTKNREGIIVLLDWPSGQLNSTSPGHYRLLVFITSSSSGRSRWAGVEDILLFYTGSLVYTGQTGVDDAEPV